MLDAGKAAQGLGDGALGDARCAGGRHCRCRVLAVVTARDQRLRGERVVVAELDALRCARDGAPAARHDGGIARPLRREEAQLGVAIRLEAAVAVDVVGLKVEQHGDARREGVDVLELERRGLADDPRVLGDSLPAVGDAGDRPPHVARDLHRPPGGTEDRADQLGGGGLAVGARHGDEGPRREQPEPELDLAPHGDAAAARLDDERLLARHAGALDEQASAVEQGRVVVGAELGVDTADSHAAPLQRLGGGDPGARQAEHDGHGGQPRGAAHDGLIPGRT